MSAWVVTQHTGDDYRPAFLDVSSTMAANVVADFIASSICSEGTAFF